MTSSQDAPYPPDWLKIARQDWHRMRVLLKDDDPDGAAYFLQQSLEKYLKAYLLGKGWKLRKIHVLQTLLDEASQHDASLVNFRPLCERVSSFYFLERYPSLGESDLEVTDVEKELAESGHLIRSLFPGQSLD